MSNEIQNNDLLLPGELGVVIVAKERRKITCVQADYKNGAVTFTIGALYNHFTEPEDAEFEIVEPKQLKSQ
jgi:hypothetical protein